jgi:hypothetical protein
MTELEAEERREYVIYNKTSNTLRRANETEVKSFIESANLNCCTDRTDKRGRTKIHCGGIKVAEIYNINTYKPREVNDDTKFMM